MTQQYYFVCSIGPVQDFIKTARTSQDLWFGSWMLSELAKAAAKALKGHTLIFPAPEKPEDLDPGSQMDVSNKVVALITDEPKEVGERVKHAVGTRLGELAKMSFDAVEANGKFDRTLAEAQLQTLTEFYWAAAPYEEGQYAAARQRAEALLNARKNTRKFRQAHGKDGLPKSSLDGFRESVLLKEPEGGFSFWKYKADKGEALSGVDLLKRWGQRVGGVTFESTTDISGVKLTPSAP